MAEEARGSRRAIPIVSIIGSSRSGKTTPIEKLMPELKRRGYRVATIEELVESCLKTTAEGWKFVRWGLGDSGDILEPGRAVRKAIKQMQAVRATISEQLCSKWEFRQFIEEEWIDYARINLCIAGSFTEAHKIDGWCETHYSKRATHNPLGPVSTAACPHMNLAAPRFDVQECVIRGTGDRPGGVRNDISSVPLQWADGYLLPPEGPGLGIEFNRAAARHHPFEMHELPHLRRLDGSLTNW